MGKNLLIHTWKVDKEYGPQSPAVRSCPIKMVIGPDNEIRELRIPGIDHVTIESDTCSWQHSTLKTYQQKKKS